MKITTRAQNVLVKASIIKLPLTEVQAAELVLALSLLPEQNATTTAVIAALTPAPVVAA